VWHTGGHCSGWRVPNAQVLYHRKMFFYYVVMSVTRSFNFALHLFEEVFTIFYLYINVQDMCKIKIDGITLKQVEKLKY